MEIQIIFQNKDLLVINKPAGLVVNEASTVKEPSLQSWISENHWTNVKQDPDDEFISRKGLVHRLDKDTSGLLILALNRDSFIFLQSQFKKRQVIKKYLALTHGKAVPEKGSINVPVGRVPWNRERFGVMVGGKPAKTTYQVDSYYQLENENYSLLKLLPQTGRTHQIRVHLKYLGHPVVSDKFYCGRKVYRRDLKFCPRLFLHANFLEFTLPFSTKKRQLKCDLPKELKVVLESMTKIS